MFHKSALLLALAAVSHVSADAASDKKAAEAALVGKLRLAPVATDRISLLSTDDEFAFDFFDPAAAATVGKGGKIITANAATFPAVIGTGSAMAVGLLDACSMNTPHMHPRATEMQISVNSTIRTGLITENGARFIMTELPPGSMTLFPMGSIHFQVNDGCEPALFVASFNSEDPGALQVAQRFFGLPLDVVGATLGDLGVEAVAGLEAQIPDNVAIATDACLKRCGLTRPSQPTLQRQPRVSGNALPGSSYTSNGATTNTYTQPAYNTPPPQSYATATATMTHGTSKWVTTYTSYAGTPAPTYAPSPVNHVIKVGIDGLKFTPANISAAIGDTVTFEFHPKNHTVTQSSFLHPCKALAETSTTGQVGFKSGFVNVSEGVTDFPTFKITVNDTAPIWGYCGQQGPPVHCTQGMVFSINAVESGPNNFEAFQKLANNSGSAVGVSGAAANFASDLEGSNGNGGSNKPSPTIIALLAINGVLVVGLIVLGGLYLRKRRAASRYSRQKQLYTSISVSGDPLFVAPEKISQYEDAEGHAAARAGDNTPLTHGLTHGPYYDPHEPVSRPASRQR